MAKLSSLKIKMGQMQYEKQRKEHKLQAMKVGMSQDNRFACCMIMGSDLSLLAPALFLFWRKNKKNPEIRCASSSLVNGSGFYLFIYFNYLSTVITSLKQVNHLWSDQLSNMTSQVQSQVPSAYLWFFKPQVRFNLRFLSASAGVSVSFFPPSVHFSHWLPFSNFLLFSSPFFNLSMLDPRCGHSDMYFLSSPPRHECSPLPSHMLALGAGVSCEPARHVSICKPLFCGLCVVTGGGGVGVRHFLSGENILTYTVVLCWTGGARHAETAAGGQRWRDEETTGWDRL